MRPLAAFVMLLVLAANATPQSTPAAAPPQPAQAAHGPADVGGTTAARVAVDLVVRDKKGRLVRDLSEKDVEVLEDGAPQELLSVRLIDTGGGARVPGASPTSPTAPSPSSPSSDDHPLYLAFVFDRLSPQGRHTAHDAAIEWLQRPAPPTRQVGVFRIDQRLDTLMSFSNDSAAARQAVDLILGSAPTSYSSKSDRERLRSLRQSMLAVGDPDRPGVKGGSPAAVPGSLPADTSGVEIGRSMDALRGAQPLTLGDHSAAYALLKVESAMLEASEALERDQQGLTTVNSLLALVNGLKTARGRKAIVFFSEGLMLPPRAADALRSVVSEANRGGVTFYAADAAGLRTISSASETRRDLASIAQVLDNPDSARPGELLKAIERNEDILRSDPHSSLATLARETGGFLVSDTNAIASALQAAEEDLSSYYLLEYAPGNELWDGRFRHIEVKVRRAGVHVQARRGYFAARTPMPTPLLAYEASVLAALELAPKAKDFEFATTALRVPDMAEEYAVPIVVEVKGDAPTLLRDEKTKRYSQDFTVLVLVRDDGGRVLRKLSRRFASAGSLDKADDARKGSLVILRETWLAAGRYTVEVAVQDAPSGRLGVQRIPLEIADESQMGLRVSHLAVVGHAVPRGEGRPDAPSLVAEGLQLYPSAGAPISLAAGKPIAFFLSAQSTPGRQTPRALVELLREGGAVFQAPVEFKAAIGRSTLLGGVPLDGLSAGEYVLRTSVQDGVDLAVRATSLTVAP